MKKPYLFLTRTLSTVSLIFTFLLFAFNNIQAQFPVEQIQYEVATQMNQTVTYDLGFGGTTYTSFELITEPSNGDFNYIDSLGYQYITYTPDTDFIGSDFAELFICFDEFFCAELQFFIDVYEFAPVNAVDDYFGFYSEDSIIGIDPLSNDTGENITITDYEEPANGILTLEADGTMIYIPDDDFTGQDVFGYTICDDAGQCDSAFIIIEIYEPFTYTFFGETYTNQPFVFNSYFYFFFPYPTEVTVTDTPSNGTITITYPDEISYEIIYTPNTDFVGTDTVFFNIASEFEEQFNVELIVNVSEPEPVVANDDFFSTQSGLQIALNVLNNDIGLETSFSGFTGDLAGGILEEIDGIWYYTPNSEFVGEEVLTYTVCDGLGFCDNANVFITVSEVPVFEYPLDLTCYAGGTVSFSSFDFFFFPTEGIVFTIESEPLFGTLSVEEIDIFESIFIYTPDADFVGADTFTVTFFDPWFGNTIVDVTVEVIEPSPVVANDDFYQAPATTILIYPFANDVGFDLTDLTLLGDVANGVIEQTGPEELTYMPNDGFVGTEEVDYSVCDGLGNCDTATITINVTEEFIETYFINYFMEAGQTLSFNSLDLLGIPLVEAAEVIQDPSNGVLEVSSTFPDFIANYTPNEGFSGEDSFIVSLDGTIFGLGTIHVIFYIEVFDPTAVATFDDYFYLNGGESIDLANALFNDNGTDISITDVQSPDFGEVYQEGDTWFYTAPLEYEGEDIFEYTICNSAGECATGSIIIYVSNTSPFPGDFVYEIAIFEGDTAIISDFASLGINIILISDMANGFVSIDTSGIVTIVPESGFTGTDTFTVSASSLGSILVLVNVMPAEENINAVGDYYQIGVNETAIFDVVANDSGDGIALSSVSGSTYGELFINDEGQVSYTPNTDFSGYDYFTYTLCNSFGVCEDASVTIWVYDSDVIGIFEPVPFDFVTEVNVPFMFYFEGVSFLDASFGTYFTVFTEPANGSVTFEPDTLTFYYPPVGDTISVPGVVTYTPDTDFIGTDYFEVIVTFEALGFEVLLQVSVDVLDLDPLGTPSDPTMFRVNMMESSAEPIEGEEGVVGIPDIPSEFDVSVYPNPFTEQLNINSTIADNYTVNIFDVSGKLILSQEGNGIGNTTLNVANLNAGSYIVQLQTTDRQQSKAKVIVKQ